MHRGVTRLLQLFVGEKEKHPRLRFPGLVPPPSPLSAACVTSKSARFFPLLPTNEFHGQFDGGVHLTSAISY